MHLELTVLQVNYIQQTHRKRVQLCDYPRWGKSELDEGSQKVQTNSYKINKYWDVMYNMINIINITVCCYESC